MRPVGKGGGADNLLHRKLVGHSDGLQQRRDEFDAGLISPLLLQVADHGLQDPDQALGGLRHLDGDLVVQLQVLRDLSDRLAEPADRGGELPCTGEGVGGHELQGSRDWL